jgi:hypothetical protein
VLFSIYTRSTLCILPQRPSTVWRMFLEDIIVLTKCCRFFFTLPGVVVERGEGGGTRPVAKPIFPTRSTLYIPLPRPLIVLRWSFKDKNAYIKRRICSFLVKRAMVAYNREVGALGRLSMPYSSSQL